jgi:hypothetical protein
MKTTKFKILLGLVLTAFILSTTVIWVDASADKAVAVVLKSVGDVQAKSIKGWNKVEKGSKLMSGDQLQTKKDGYTAVMFLDDKSVVKVKPNSVLKIQGTHEGKSISKQVVMDVGEMFVQVSKQKGSFQVATPTSVASVKGTEFWVLEGMDGTKIIGIDGLIELLNNVSGTKMNVGAGQTGSSGKDGSVVVNPTKDEDIPDAGVLQEEIKIKFRDAEGNEKEIKIKF